MIKRLLIHLLIPKWWTHRAFRAADLAAIEAAIKDSEKTHRGELRFIIEGPLPLPLLWRNAPVRARAAQLFAQMGVWDTAGNSGILIYVQLVDHCVEILADRGIAQRVPQAEWDAICRGMEAAFRLKAYQRGALEAIALAGELLARNFPAGQHNVNELPDKPVQI
jgi:hypothetical protein